MSVCTDQQGHAAFQAGHYSQVQCYVALSCSSHLLQLASMLQAPSRGRQPLPVPCLTWRELLQNPASLWVLCNRKKDCGHEKQLQEPSSARCWFGGRWR
jgi:hypothetical protein